MSTIGAIGAVVLASAAIGALLTYIADELHHEHLDHPKQEKP